MFKNKFLVLAVTLILGITILVGCNKTIVEEPTDIEKVKSYIATTTYKDLSLNKILDDLLLNGESIRIADLNYVIGKDGYLVSLNIKYHDSDKNESKILVYRKDMDRLSYISSSNTIVDDTGYVNPAKLIDENMKIDINNLMTSQEHKNVFVGVISTNEIQIDIKDYEKLYLNNVETTEDISKVSAIFITVYPQPIQPGDKITYYIYE